MTTVIRSAALFSLILGGLVACDAEPTPSEEDLEARAAVAEPLAIRYCVERWDDELTVEIDPAWGCLEGSSYDTETEETFQQCLEGEIVEVTYTRIDNFACVDGEWELTFSQCAVNGCSPKFVYTGVLCDK